MAENKSTAQIIYETLSGGLTGNSGAMLSWQRVNAINSAPYSPIIELDAFTLRDLCKKAAERIKK
jgi:hypothetical protein